MKSSLIRNVTNSNPAIVCINKETKHYFYDGDYVKFREVRGMIELNSLPPTRIEVIDCY